MAHGKSSLTTVVTIRLKNETIAKIQKALDSYKNQDGTVGKYCSNVIERYAFRHEKKTPEKSPEKFNGITGTGI
jgi:hypothetical protein